MTYLWFDSLGRVVRTGKNPDVRVVASGRIEIPDSVAAAVEARMDAYYVVAGELVTEGESVELTPDVPASVSPLQARRALRAANLLATVTAALEAADDETREAWEYATEIRRDNALVAAVAVGVGLTTEQVDALFIAAAAL